MELPGYPRNDAEYSLPALRQLPRKRIERLAWQVPDTAWVIVVGVICLVLAPHDPRRFRSVLGATIDFLCASACYVAGLRLHGRIAAISAALMVATSPVFASLCVRSILCRGRQLALRLLLWQPTGLGG